MSLTINTKTYDEDSQLSANGIRYAGPAQTLQTNDLCDLKRTRPQATLDNPGAGRGQIKLTRTMTDGTSVIALDGLLDITWRIPADADETEIDALLNDAGALLSSAVGKDIVKKQDITH